VLRIKKQRKNVYFKESSVSESSSNELTFTVRIPEDYCMGDGLREQYAAVVGNKLKIEFVIPVLPKKEMI
jgi:hypothetical protein